MYIVAGQLTGGTCERKTLGKLSRRRSFRIPCPVWDFSPDAAFRVLDAWLRADVENIARRRLGRVATRTFVRWTPNAIPENLVYARYYYGPHHDVAERAVTPILTALGDNYRHYGCTEKFEALRAYLKLLEPYLDDHGKEMTTPKPTAD